MSNLHDLFEARRTPRTQIKTADRVETDFADTFGSKAKFQAPAKTQQSAPAVSKVRGTSADNTRERMADVNMPPEAAEKMSIIQQMQNSDEISDIEARRNAGLGNATEPNEPATPGQDLAVVSKEISADTNIKPEWHAVKHLPGYLSSSIRAMGRRVFGTFTDTPIEDINIVASIGGGPNSEAEVGAVINWLQQNATPDTAAKMHFDKTIPDYGAEMIVFKTDSDTFLAVKDPMGSYVYSWPTADELGHIEGRKQLR